MITSNQTPVKKASKSETGHARNVANFRELTTYAESLGSLYNPAKEALKLPSLQALLAEAANSIDKVNTAFIDFSNTIAARETAFKPLSKLVSRANNSFKVSDITDEVIQNAVSIVNRLQGRRVSAKLTEEEKKALAEQGKEVNQISASHLSFESRLDNMDKFVKLLSSSPQYAPNEEALKTSSLTALFGDLKAKNMAAVTADITLKNARIARNEIMYKDKSGLVDIAQEVKIYLKSLDGSTGKTYKAISRLEFAKIK